MDGLTTESTEYANDSNTTDSVPNYLTPSRWEINFYIIGYSISAFLSILLNCVNIITVPRVQNCFGENTKLCLMCLAIVDLFTGVCSTSGVLFACVPVPRMVYDAVVVLCSAFVWQSMLILTLASVDRYIAVTRPLRYFTLASRKRMIGALILVMILPLLTSGASYLQSRLTGVCHRYGEVCVSVTKPSFMIYHVLPFTAVTITTFANVRLLRIARRHARQIAAVEAAVNAGNIAPPLPSSAGLKGLKTIFVITFAFYLAWLPTNLVQFLSPIHGIKIPRIFILILRYVITCNSWWNACVYWIMNESYRNVLIKMITHHFRCCNRSEDETFRPANQPAYIPPV